MYINEFFDIYVLLFTIFELLLYNQNTNKNFLRNFNVLACYEFPFEFYKQIQIIFYEIKSKYVLMQSVKK